MYSGVVGNSVLSTDASTVTTIEASTAIREGVLVATQASSASQDLNIPLFKNQIYSLWLSGVGFCWLLLEDIELPT